MKTVVGKMVTIWQLIVEPGAQNVMYNGWI